MMNVILVLLTDGKLIVNHPWIVRLYVGFNAFFKNFYNNDFINDSKSHYPKKKKAFAFGITYLLDEKLFFGDKGKTADTEAYEHESE